VRGELLQAVKAACRSAVRELFDNDNSSMQLDAPALLCPPLAALHAKYAGSDETAATPAALDCTL